MFLVSDHEDALHVGLVVLVPPWHFSQERHVLLVCHEIVTVRVFLGLQAVRLLHEISIFLVLLEPLLVPHREIWIFHVLLAFYYALLYLPDDQDRHRLVRHNRPVTLISQVVFYCRFHSYYDHVLAHHRSI